MGGNTIKKQMKLILNRMKKDIKNFYPIILALIFYWIVTQIMFQTFCFFRIALGIPCAGCGMTRAVIYLITGDIKNAMQLNPAAPFWVAFLICFFWKHYIVGDEKKSIIIIWLIITCIITYVIYLCRIFTNTLCGI